MSDSESSCKDLYHELFNICINIILTKNIGHIVSWAWWAWNPWYSIRFRPYIVVWSHFRPYKVVPDHISVGSYPVATIWMISKNFDFANFQPMTRLKIGWPAVTLIAMPLWWMIIFASLGSVFAPPIFPKELANFLLALHSLRWVAPLVALPRVH